MPKPTVLLADDEPVFVSVFALILQDQDWNVETARDGREALDLLSHRRFDVAILDFRMPHLDGVEVLEAARSRGIPTDVIILTAYGSTELAVRATQLGARDYLQKPTAPSSLIAAIRDLLERHSIPPHVVAAQLDIYLQSRAHDPSLTFADLMVRFKISSSYGYKLFRDHIGVSFRRRLAHYRVERAKLLLRSTDLAMYEIAELCGFKSQQRFRDTFHRLEGISPRRYREMGEDRR